MATERKRSVGTDQIMQDELLEVTGALMVTEGFNGAPTGKIGLGVVTGSDGKKRAAIKVGSVAFQMARMDDLGSENPNPGTGSAESVIVEWNG
ncbi:MAG: hypothetical protein INR69_23180 [Mucilaginibacter polytrichastri]|nr:hypothetical protein [Mucilaginibacter polytrichastri]